ncbi:uncharacterized protein BKCO1_640003 [Diplodia corticola]|uniref:Uncharacterized protein n=1 Tax=Diplodia corticola TaxID=236234 RepID=A0A1J9RRT9_9PEZI|nr:uncharacterized protein BKCO1_640003 [Diplodia corticola]OJD30245.1 hypothetical protein BKCO1_640003 [Diplodia corticola]
MDPSTTVDPGRLKHPEAIYDKILRRSNGDRDAVPVQGVTRIYKDQFEHLMGLIKSNDKLYRSVARHVKFSFARNKLFYSFPDLVHRLFAGLLRSMIDTKIAEVAERYARRDADGNVLKNVASAITQVRAIDIDGIDADGVWEFNWGSGAQAKRLCFALDAAHAVDYNVAERRMMRLMAANKGRPGMAILVRMSNSRMELDHTKSEHKRADYTILKVTQQNLDLGKKPYVFISSRTRVKFRHKNGKERHGELRIPIRDMIGSRHTVRDLIWSSHVRFVNEDDPVTVAILEEDIVITHHELWMSLEMAENAHARKLRALNQAS